jgi:hypothetical protein
MSVIWAVWHHPIVRQLSDPIPVVATGSYEEMEELFFKLSDDPEVDPFYIEFGPCDENQQPLKNAEHLWP